MSSNKPFGGVAECYAFKSRLQEYAQKVGIVTPTYHTVKDGPSHEPVFQSTVIVDNVTYSSVPGFYNRKAAEQSAVEIALLELHKSGQRTDCIPVLHETGLCKNLLQEYAQKMNYAIPSYTCNTVPLTKTPFSCTVEIGDIRYIGASAKTKKEAEIKAARTALLAIQSCACGNGFNGSNGVSSLTVLPGKKKGREPDVQAETTKHIKAKKAFMKKRGRNGRFSRKRNEVQKINENLEVQNGEDKFRSSDVNSLAADDNLQRGEVDIPKVHFNKNSSIGGGSADPKPNGEVRSNGVNLLSTANNCQQVGVEQSEIHFNGSSVDTIGGESANHCCEMLIVTSDQYLQNEEQMNAYNTGSNNECSGLKETNIVEVNCGFESESVHGTVLSAPQHELEYHEPGDLPTINANHSHVNPVDANDVSPVPNEPVDTDSCYGQFQI